MSVTVERRTRLRVEGTVQGVGFRPYVYRLAGELGLAGFVLNDSRGVLIEVEGDDALVDRFVVRLRDEAPPLAVIDRVLGEEREPIGHTGFQIVESPSGGVAGAAVTPDTATCGDCLRELLDPDNRRHRYPFINCTNCGPRFTIVRRVPYDRPSTTMAGFRMCARCQAEYDDPEDRRFHAQPNACSDCGPSLTLLRADGTPERPGGGPLAAAVEALLAGRIVAVKGVGGYHLACLANDPGAVAELRSRKHREDKPFALMVASAEAAADLVLLGPGERAMLERPERPIVLAPRLPSAAVAPAVAPGAPELGVMLPYSPLHHLLAADAEAPLVMTSGNVSDEPICYRDEDALRRLAGIADLLLVHDRPIHTRTDDSVVRIVDTDRDRPLMLRRSRGFVPASVRLPGGAPRPILACGAEQKNTFCLAKDDRAWIGHHVGDLENYETLRSFIDGIEHFELLFAVTPEVVAHDLHPEYLSTKYALERDGVETIGVQHHHAHLAAALAEHEELGQAVGAIFDGTGYGDDGTIWGGELLVGDCAGYRRAGHLLAVRMPGGAQAVRQPWRMACAWLDAAGEHEPPPALASVVDGRTWEQVRGLCGSDLGSLQTTSMGRLFDGVAAMCGVRAEVTYEGQAAIELEAMADPAERTAYPVDLESGPHGLVIDPRETILAATSDLADGVGVPAVSGRFHNAIARATVEACARVAAAQGLDRAVLAGGVYQNRRLIESVAIGLAHAGLRVVTPERLPINDGGISYGQAAVAARRMAAG